MALLLAIDTAGPRLQLALAPPGAAADLLCEDMPTGQAERLFPAIGELLARNGAGYSDLTRIAVTTGPGSFTGVRIGLSAARGLGLALAIPVVGLPTLTALSLAAGQAPVAIVLDARRGEAYAQLFAGPGRADGPARLMPLDDALALAPPGTAPLTSSVVDMAAFAAFAAAADPAAFPPDAAYIRDADAKPQEKFRVARAQAPA